jgi:hypothetical protein
MHNIVDLRPAVSVERVRQALSTTPKIWPIDERVGAYLFEQVTVYRRHPSLDRIAADLGLLARVASRSVNKLVKLGILRVARHNGAATYHFTLDTALARLASFERFVARINARRPDLPGIEPFSA